jgi:hypothetical protein
MPEQATSLANPAYFEFTCKADNSVFVIQLTQQHKIDRAREILGGEQKDHLLVIGKIVKAKKAYNPRWSYHLEPTTIDFVEAAVEVCDATPSYVEEHLKEAGNAFLPGLTWCPWCSRLAREVSP